MLSHLRYTIGYVWVGITALGLLLGGPWMWLGIGVGLTVWVVGDPFSGDFTEKVEYRDTWILEAIIYSYVPIIKYGWLASIFAAFVPPLFQRLMAPQLIAWDENFATPAERLIADRQNRDSGVTGLTEVAA